MDRPLDTTNYASEFDSELEHERQQLLRRRFLWYTGTVLALSVISLVIGIFAVREAMSGLRGSEAAAAWISLLVNGLVFGLSGQPFSSFFFLKICVCRFPN